MSSAVPDRLPDGPAIPPDGLYDHRFSGVARGVRLYLLPLVAVAAGWALAGSAALLWTSFLVRTGIGPLLGPATLVVPLLNGVNAHEALLPAVGRERMGKGLTRIISEVATPGKIRHIGVDPYMALAEWDGRASPRAEALVGALAQAGVHAEIPPDIDAALWHKFHPFADGETEVRGMTWDADGPPPHRRVAIVRGNGLAGSGGGALPDQLMVRCNVFQGSWPYTNEERWYDR